MNLFWKKLTGRLIPTEKLEQQEAELIQDMIRYDKVEKSAELVEYNQLFHIVKSAKFQENKKTLQNRKYKDTEEYRVNTKFRKMQNSKKIQDYFDTLNSAGLKAYMAFKATPEFEQLGDKKAVAASEKLRELKNFEHSKAYKNYVRFHESYVIKEYNELKEKVTSADFKAKNDFWANAKRWHTTPEYAQEQRMYELQKTSDISFFLNEKPSRFEKIRQLQLAFSDDFSWKTVAESKWQSGFHYKSPVLKGVHSFANEQQANNNGKNVSAGNGRLVIATRHEKATASAWEVTKGFIEKEFSYTSDVIQSADTFRQKNGLFRAKIKTHGAIHHAFWLGADGKLPHVNIFHFDGKSITVGNAGKSGFEGTVIKGISSADYFIYSLIWTPKELIWQVNNIEVFRTTNNVPAESLYLSLNSFISQKQHANDGSFEVEWVKVYSL